MGKLKQKKDSLVEFNRKYANNNKACIDYFIHCKWPTGFYCEKCGCIHYYDIKRGNVLQCKECGHQHYLHANTIFQDNKLELYKLMLGMFLIFTLNKGISGVELASQLDINIKTAQLLIRKCRILMAHSNSDHTLDSLFYEADTAYIGAKSSGEHKAGLGSDQQPFFVMLSTHQENNYPRFIKLHVIPKDNQELTEKILKKSMKLDKNRKLNTDGKLTFNILSNVVQLHSEKITNYEEDHRLKWLNIITGNVKNNILGIYHGVCKRDLPLFLNEQEWRFNHRNIGSHIMERIMKYILQSSPIPRRAITTVLNLAEGYFNTTCI